LGLIDFVFVTLDQSCVLSLKVGPYNLPGYSYFILFREKDIDSNAVILCLDTKTPEYSRDSFSIVTDDLCVGEKINANAKVLPFWSLFSSRLSSLG